MIPNVPITPVYGIVPAAGLGRRMGRAKQTLPFRGSTMVGSVVRTLLDAGLDTVVLVTRSELVTRLGLPIDKRLSVAVNDDASSQMIDSIRIGLSALFDDGAASGGAKEDKPSLVDRATDCTGILVVPGDMPGLGVATCSLCVETYRREPTKIIVAARDGRRGHPLIFPAALRQAVRQLDGGLNALLDLYRDRVQLVETGDPAALEDVDTWDQFRSLSPAPWHRENDTIR
jgi:molybdenum cofactor cytidylyltransferase